MKIYALSDLHLSINTDKPMDIFGGAWENYWEQIKENWQKTVKETDIVLIAGDISWALDLKDAIFDLEEIAKLNGRKILIRGNHDYWWSSYNKVCKVLPENIYAIQNNCIELDGVVFAGTRGWMVAPIGNMNEQDKKIFNRELLRLEMSLNAAKKQVEDSEKPIILMTHYPPFNARFDDSVVTDLINRYDIYAVVYGHLHGKDCRVKHKVDKQGVPYYLTSCDMVGNSPVLICEID